jgi:competence protein ComGC
MKDAKTLERETWWRNFKWTVIIVLLIIAILLIIILPLALKGSDNPKSNSQTTAQPNSNTLLN